MKNQSELPLRYDPKFKPPFRVGKKQNRAVLDDNGHEVVLFPPGNEIQAHMYVEYLNGINQFDMKNQKKIELLTDFQLFLYEKGFIEDCLWVFEKQAKKFLKKRAQKRVEELIKNSGSVAAPFVTFEKSETHLIDEFKAVINTVDLPEDDIKVVETGKGRRLYSKCNRGDVVRSYVEESNLNKGFYVLVIQCRNGQKYIVGGNHHAPTYLQPYNLSSDTKETNNEK